MNELPKIPFEGGVISTPNVPHNEATGIDHGGMCD